MKTIVSKRFSISILASLLLLMSCNKDDDGGGNTPPPTVNKTQLLTAKNWRITAHNVDPAIDIDNNGTQENNLLPFYAACDLDDIRKFNTNGSYTFEEGATKCDPNNPQVYQTGTWLWNSDNTRLITTASSNVSVDALVPTLNATTMVLVTTVVSNGVTYTETITFN